MFVMSKGLFDEREKDFCEGSGRLAKTVALPESEIARNAVIQRFEIRGASATVEGE
jgi:hypothetical protein